MGQHDTQKTSIFKLRSTEAPYKFLSANNVFQMNTEDLDPLKILLQ